MSKAAELTVITAEGEHRVDLNGLLSIGRHPENTLQLLDKIVSKQHCVIEQTEQGFVLKDLDSLNGTSVNGDKIKERILLDGDEIKLGSTRLVFQLKSKPQEKSHEPKNDGMAPTVGSGGVARVSPPKLAVKGPRSPMVSQPPQLPPISLPRVAVGAVESHIHSRLAVAKSDNFLPEHQVASEASLRQDYEKLRVSHEVSRALGDIRDIHVLLNTILDCAFNLLHADGGVILLFDETKELKPQCVRSRKGGESEDEIVLSKTILNEVLRDKTAVLSSDALLDSRFQGAHSVIMQGIRSTMAFPLIHNQEILGVLLLHSQIATNAFGEKDLQVLQTVSSQAAAAIQNITFSKKLEKEFLARERFSRLLPPAIVDQVVQGKVEIAKSGELRPATVMFSDIRGFTRMSEASNPQHIVDMLNEYFEHMVEIIFEHEGTLDKFIGDEIMALFGAPVAHPDDPVRAVRTACEMLRTLDAFNRRRAELAQDPISVGIGINTGDVIAGYLGSSRALEYTVIGDVVNTASRLCGFAKAGEILISESTFHAIKGQFDVVELAPVQLKGKAHPVRIFQVNPDPVRIEGSGGGRTNPSIAP